MDGDPAVSANIYTQRKSHSFITYRDPIKKVTYVSISTLQAQGTRITYRQYIKKVIPYSNTIKKAYRVRRLIIKGTLPLRRK